MPAVPGAVITAVAALRADLARDVRAGGIADDAACYQTDGSEYDTACERAQTTIKQALTCICGNWRKDKARANDKTSC